MPLNLTYIDLFAGAGGMSEGFIQAGFKPIAHVESNAAACYSLKTRMAFHYLKSIGRETLLLLFKRQHQSTKVLFHIEERNSGFSYKC